MPDSAELLREFRELRQEIRDALFGVSENKYTGLFVRMDRLERAEAIRKWMLRAIGTCVVTLMGRMVWSYFVK